MKKQFKNTTSVIGFLLVLCITFSCQPSSSPKGSQALNIELKKDTLQINMILLPGQLGKLKLANKFVGIVPRKLGKESDGHDIDLYIVDTPAYSFDEFTTDKITQQKITAKKISSIDQLIHELGGLVPGGITVVAKLTVDVKNGVMTVTNAASSTTVTCTCPCSVSMGNESASCK